MANRIIKESIRTSKSVNRMTDFQFRLWLYLITYVDDYGRGSADPELLKGMVFPRRRGVGRTAIQKGLAQLAENGSVLLYEVEGEPYFCFPNWGAHQRIQTKKARFPAPEEDLEQSTVTHGGSRYSTVTHGDSRCSTVGHGDPPPESNPNPNPNPNPNSNPKKKKTAARFSPPTLEEVKKYCEERNNGLDAQYFFNFYQGKGWKVGSTPMADWQACVRTWEARQKQEGGQKQQPSFDMDLVCSRFELGKVK